MNMTSMSDEGGLETVISTSGEVLDNEEMYVSQEKQLPPAESLESMAMLGQSPGGMATVATTGPQCRGCKAPSVRTSAFVRIVDLTFESEA